jgi:8-oxo-dGTP pyrophosphatase MutT (NUDIX family)
VVNKPPATGRKSQARQRPRAQYGALPYRWEPDLEILLVTSRETGRWVIPKGWPMRSKSARAAAALEALEEAGVEGRMARRALGAYDYMKVLRNGEGQTCRVEVFPLEVTLQRSAWREQDQRTTRWFDWESAAASVREPGLAGLIRKFAGQATRTAPGAAATL